MIIVLVVDVYDDLTNGTTMTAYRFAQMLRRRGHEVRVVAVAGKEHNPYAVRELTCPVATSFAHKQGFAFAKSDEAVFRKAFQGADVAHFLLPLPFECKAAKIAREMGVPCSAAFHLQPENITYITHTDKVNWLVPFIYRFFNKTFYKNFDHIHCPSRFIASQLEQNGYQAKLHVISNGVDDDFIPTRSEKQQEQLSQEEDGLFRILMIGRLSPEKRQRVLIEAVQQSRYADKIQLYLAGKGPCKEALIRQGEKLPHPPVFGFYQKEALISLIHSCDLYVHASVIEIEAISCMEAFSCGLVPVICNSPRSATPQFALDDRSLFEPDNAADLARKIDYWIEHPEERAAMSVEYAKEGDQYRVNQSIIAAERMFEEVIRDDKAKRGKQDA
ncbi:MAG TPA: glycosyltransferase [Candidatus Gallacutalibacter stercoravium]|nr:glycosyltransferase [Candidatus Gallacutalibacter stercoravium]